MKSTFLKAKGICKTYESDGEEFQAIKNLSIEIYEKDFTVIMGSSGSGKSTLLYLLSGLDNLTSGEVVLDGVKIESLKDKKMAEFRREKIGFVFQSINLSPNLTIFENIIVPGFLKQKNKKAVEEKAYKLLTDMGLCNQIKRLPSQVSGGQQQRAAIARGLINSPKVLFADEPTGSLNSAQGDSVLDILSDINKEGQSIVMVTHDLKAACRANRILFIKDGAINGELNLSTYTKEAILQREDKIFTFLKDRGW